MSLITWLIFGFLIGALTYLIDTKSSKGGILGSIMLGVTGSMIGGIIAELVFNLSLKSFDIITLSAITIGALFLLFIRRLIYSL